LKSNGKPLSDEEHIETLRALQASDGNLTAAGRVLGINRASVRDRIRQAEKRGLTLDPKRIDPLSQEIKISQPPPNETIEELIERKKRNIGRSLEHEQYASLVPVEVKEPGPIGLCLIGDPHIDDDGCDIISLERDLKIIGKTPGFFAGHVGDLTNNWVGRLQRLYAHQSTRFDEGLRLMEWMLGLCPNLFVINGNHDVWNNGADLIRFIVRPSPTIHQSHGARIALRWPGRQEIRIHARHDFAGSSQFSDTHGHKRELLWGHRDHILVAGHKHVDEARCEPSIDGMAHWLFRVSGYKVIDEYAKERNFRPKRLAPSVSLVIDPTQKIPAEQVKPFWCHQTAADYLTWLRGRK